MATCVTCGNDYWLAFEIKTVTGDTYTFDSFECAMEKLAPRCEQCNVRIVGHGVEVAGMFFCCANCARINSDLGEQIRDAVGAHPA
ncbi:Prokaryotic metallothionein [Kitasatospora sp. NPDC017646]|uniref:Prokaryotic metallothionein n=1 Tax=Kitasatospora sp. NPDC017646 TaxID=3364024 RepID=UPI00378CB48F